MIVVNDTRGNNTKNFSKKRCGANLSAFYDEKIDPGLLTQVAGYQ
jgi:hypothetical protein